MTDLTDPAARRGHMILRGEVILTTTQTAHLLAAAMGSPVDLDDPRHPGGEILAQLWGDLAAVDHQAAQAAWDSARDFATPSQLVAVADLLGEVRP